MTFWTTIQRDGVVHRVLPLLFFHVVQPNLIADIHSDHLFCLQSVSPMVA